MVWDLSRLRYTVRKITGKFDVNQLPDVLKQLLVKMLSRENVNKTDSVCMQRG